MRTIPKEITKELLEKLYVKEEKSQREIGNLLKKSPVQVSRYLKRFKIKARSFSTKGRKAWNKGVPMREESKNKLSIAHTGKKLSKEHRAKVIKTLRYGLKGKDNPNWKGGSFIKEGYKWIRIDDFYVPEHRLVMEKYLKRKLKTEENIHHINKNKLDNRIENLVIVSNKEHHRSFHWNEEERKEQSERTKRSRSKRFWSTKKLV